MKINVYLAVVLLLVLAGVFGGISVIIGTVNTDGMPDFIVVFVNGLKYVFLTSAVAPFFVIVRNVYGYFTNKAANPNTQIEYEGKKLLETWLVYEGYIKGIGILVVTFAVGTKYAPYSYMISGALAFIVDLIRKSLSDIAAGRSAPV